MSKLSIKPEFPPLLPVGFHNYTLAQFSSEFVQKFSGSSTRQAIFLKFEEIFNELKRVGIAVTPENRTA